MSTPTMSFAQEQALRLVLENGYLDASDAAALTRTSHRNAYNSYVRDRAVSPADSESNSMATGNQAVTGLPTLSSSTNMPITPPDSGDEEGNSSGQETQEELYVSPMTPEAQARIAAIPKYTSDASLPTLPTELQQQIFGYLDKIDSACLGLTSIHAYNMYVAIYGKKMPLNTRRVGPNTEESCWEIVGVRRCTHCDTDRCELWRHIKSWMMRRPSELRALEYCSMKHVFGSPAKANAPPTCYRSKPSKPRRCGRHPDRTITMHESDPKFMKENVKEASQQ